jgi:hypothetical protein
VKGEDEDADKFLNAVLPIDMPSRLPVIGPASEVVSDLDLALCNRLTSKWLQECRIKHPQCTAAKLSSGSTLPTRVLDAGCGNSATSSTIRLLETNQGQVAEYVALSYCWGRTGNVTTTKGTLEERKKGISRSILPKSFQDAVDLIRCLGIRYLWIDALCIIQDDVADWEREAAKMGDVYANALLTISTDAASDPTVGIFTARKSELVSTTDVMGLGIRREVRPARNVVVERFPITDKTGKTHVVYTREPLDHSNIILPRSYHDLTYPLMSRAWTLQERLLSGRILHVTAAELIWECKTTLRCECGTIERDSDYMSGNPSPKITFDIAIQDIVEEGRKALAFKVEKEQTSPRTPKASQEWTLLVGGYSNRMLTYETDKLRAVSALARRFSLTDNDLISLPRTYLAGLWLEDLPWLLCWRVFLRRFEKRTEKYCAPTWSWASVSTPVIWDKEVFAARARIQVVDVSTAPVTQANVFGQVKGACVMLSGPVQRAAVETEGVRHGAVLALRNARGERIFFVPDLNPPESPHSGQQGEASPSPPLRDRAEVVCLWVLQGGSEDKAYALVLASAPEDAIAQCLCLPLFTNTAAGTVFERAGLITTMSRVYQRNEVSVARWFSGAKTETVYIV